jgi:hypothetical protein
MRVLAVVMLVSLGCGAPKPDPDEPQTAAEKQRREARASGEVDSDGGRWGGWKYQGDRQDCFYVVGRRCFKTEKGACNFARCAEGMCNVVGGGPAAVSCKKPGSGS